VNGTDLPARNGEPGVLKLSAISYGQFAPEQNKAVIENERVRLGPSVRGNTILISRSNTTELVGACVYVPEDFPHLYLPDLIWEIEVDPSNGNSAKWLSYLLSSGAVRASLVARATGTSGSMKKLSMAALRVMQIWQPPFPEQERISEIITTWDRTIVQTEKLIEAKWKLKKGLMQQLLTGKQRFLEFGTVRQRTQGHFYDYPSEWAHPQIKEIASEVTVRNSSGIIQTVLSCSKYAGLVNSLEYFGKQVYSDDISNYKVVQLGQFAYPANHIEEGSIGLLDHVPSGIVSPIYIVFRTDPYKVFAPYLYALFKTETYRHIFAMATNASVDRRGSLRWKEFSSIRVPLPSFDEQRRIVTVLDVADREIKILFRQLEEYKNQKRGLMQKLLTGQIRVKATAEITTS
jgi:type I restriction enzyme S subunit